MSFRFLFELLEVLRLPLMMQQWVDKAFSFIHFLWHHQHLDEPTIINYFHILSFHFDDNSLRPILFNLNISHLCPEAPAIWPCFLTKLCKLRQISWKHFSILWRAFQGARDPCYLRGFLNILCFHTTWNQSINITTFRLIWSGWECIPLRLFMYTYV